MPRTGERQTLLFSATFPKARRAASRVSCRPRADVSQNIPAVSLSCINDPSLVGSKIIAFCR